MINSPVRAPAELAEAVRLGLNMNLESEQEIDFLDPLVRDREPAAGIIGVRINPVVGAGAIAMTSTATLKSKFGLPFTPETRQDHDNHTTV